MNIFESIGSCLNDAVQAVVEKNRINAQVNRLRLVMRSESKTMNKAYLELGKEYYKKIKSGEVTPTDEAEECCASIVKSSERFKRAIARYHELIDTQVIAGTSVGLEDNDDEENADITLCCSYEEESTAVDKLDIDGSVTAEPQDKTTEPSETTDAVEADKTEADELQSVKEKIDNLIDSTEKPSKID